MSKQQEALNELQTLLHKRLSDSDYILACELIKIILDNIKLDILKFFDILDDAT